MTKAAQTKVMKVMGWGLTSSDIDGITWLNKTFYRTRKAARKDLFFEDERVVKVELTVVGQDK